MPRIEFDYDDLDQFDPHVQEALLRLHKQQKQKAASECIPFKGIQPDVLILSSGANDRKKRDLQRNTSGGINLDDYRGTFPSIPQENR
jgi:hypothetical protein